MSGKVTVHAMIKVKPEHMDTFSSAMEKIKAYVKSDEPGTLVYRSFKADDDKNTIIMYEEYADKAAFETHKANAPFQEFAKAAKDILSEPPVIMTMTEFE